MDMPLTGFEINTSDLEFKEPGTVSWKTFTFEVARMGLLSTRTDAAGNAEPQPRGLCTRTTSM